MLIYNHDRTPVWKWTRKLIFPRLSTLVAVKSVSRYEDDGSTRINVFWCFPGRVISVSLHSLRKHLMGKHLSWDLRHRPSYGRYVCSLHWPYMVIAMTYVRVAVCDSFDVKRQQEKCCNSGNWLVTPVSGQPSLPLWKIDKASPRCHLTCAFKFSLLLQRRHSEQSVHCFFPDRWPGRRTLKNLIWNPGWHTPVVRRDSLLLRETG